MPKLKTASTRRAKRRDKLARWVITLGGVTVIASVIAILALIVGVTVPLFRAPQANVVCTCRLPGRSGASGEGSEVTGLRGQGSGRRISKSRRLLQIRPSPSSRAGRSAAWHRRRHGRHERHGLRLEQERNRCVGGLADRQVDGTRASASARRRREELRFATWSRLAPGSTRSPGPTARRPWLRSSRSQRIARMPMPPVIRFARWPASSGTEVNFATSGSRSQALCRKRPPSPSVPGAFLDAPIRGQLLGRRCSPMERLPFCGNHRRNGDGRRGNQHA